MSRSRRLARAVVVLSALDPALLNTVQTMARASGLRVLGAVEKPLTAAKLQEVLAHFHHEPEENGYLAPVEIDRQTLVDAIGAEEIEPWFQAQVVDRERPRRRRRSARALGAWRSGAAACAVPAAGRA